MPMSYTRMYKIYFITLVVRTIGIARMNLSRVTTYMRVQRPFAACHVHVHGHAARVQRTLSLWGRPRRTALFIYNAHFLTFENKVACLSRTRHENASESFLHLFRTSRLPCHFISVRRVVFICLSPRELIGPIMITAHLACLSSPPSSSS